MPERRFLVAGRVQGVGFRWWTRGVARRIGVTGTVRNRADGTVEVDARGDDAQLTALRRLLNEGPPGATVESVWESDASAVSRTPFDIAR